MRFLRSKLLVLIAGCRACVTAAQSACPSDDGSMFTTQLQFAWEGSATGYSSGSTLAADAEELLPIGAHTARIPEASDAGTTASYLNDGADGDVAFQFGNMKPIATVGEVDFKTGMVIVGVPDGNGAMLADDDTVRIVVQSESYGPISQQEAHPYLVNNGAAAITGSHVQYVDYDRSMMSQFMTSSLPASAMVKGAGELITTMYNLRGELVGARNRAGPTTTGAMDSNVDVAGNYVIPSVPRSGGVAAQEADWTMQSLCSAQLAEKELWGTGIGFEDDIFLTNEEWIVVDVGRSIVGLPGHAIDIATKTSYAWGAATVSGFEKMTNFNSESTEYVVIAISGYNGAYSPADDFMLNNKNSMGSRPDGTAWVWPQNICPARIYIGRKGYNANGDVANDFLSRNGLAYGQVYGFAVDTSSADFAWRDDWHRTHHNGDTMPGNFYPIDWRWNGTVSNFEHDGAWHFQIPPLGAAANYEFWNAAGNDASGSKTEHISPDPDGATAFFQTSTAGYFGKYVIDGLGAALSAASSTADPFPAELTATYHLYQGETPIVDFIDLGVQSKGQCANGLNQTTMCDSSQDDSNSCGSTAALGKVTFEDIDGFEAFAADGGKVYSIIQEDGGNMYGERMFIYENLLTYGSSPSSQPFKLVAQSGGASNSRMLANVGVPAGTNQGSGSHEFSGITDLSGFFASSGGQFSLQVSDAGHRKMDLAKTVPIDDKLFLICLQAHNLENAGVVSKFTADRGGQWLLYKPNIAGDGTLPSESDPGSSTQHECNPFTSDMCYIHPDYKAELDSACGTADTSDTASGASALVASIATCSMLVLFSALAV